MCDADFLTVQKTTWGSCVHLKLLIAIGMESYGSRFMCAEGLGMMLY